MPDPLEPLLAIANALRLSADTHWELRALQRRQTAMLRCLAWLFGLQLVVLLCALLTLLAVSVQIEQVYAQQTALAQALGRVAPTWTLRGPGGVCH